MEIISEYPINESVLQTISSILEDYNIAYSIRINKDSPRLLLKDSKLKTCRFCGKSFPQVSFHNRAHTPPEFTGNKKIFSTYECDACNSTYFNLFENELANFLLPFSTLSGKKGKKNRIPKYKQQGEPTIKHLDDLISITEINDDRINKLNENSLEIVLKIPTFIPEYIYRCLVRICLSFIPQEKLHIYSKTIDWLMNLNQESNMKPGMLFSTYPNNLQLNDISVQLFERKEDCVKNIPYSMFCLSYNNYAFQTYIPFCSKEKIGINLNGFPFILPTSIDLNKNHENSRIITLLDLSSKEKKSNESITITIKGEQIINDLHSHLKAQTKTSS